MRTLTSLSFRIALCSIALVSPFLFPSTIALLVAAVAGLFVPIMPVVVGLSIDLLYYPGVSLPLGTLCGVIISLVIVFVRYIARTRIM